MEMNNVNVIDIIKGITASGLPLMEGKEKLETSAILNTVVNVNEFDFMKRKYLLLHVLFFYAFTLWAQTS